MQAVVDTAITVGAFENLCDCGFECLYDTETHTLLVVAEDGTMHTVHCVSAPVTEERKAETDSIIARARARVALHPCGCGVSTCQANRDRLIACETCLRGFNGAYHVWAWSGDEKKMCDECAGRGVHWDKKRKTSA